MSTAVRRVLELLPTHCMFVITWCRLLLRFAGFDNMFLAAVGADKQWRGVINTRMPLHMEFTVEQKAMQKEYSVVTHVSPDDPPSVVITGSAKKFPLPCENGVGCIHHRVMGQMLAVEAKKQHVEFHFEPSGEEEKVRHRTSLSRVA